MNKSEILERYAIDSPSFHRISEVLSQRLRQLVEKEVPKIHSLSGRVKSKASLEQKLARPDRNYASLSDITDLVAFRVITYSEDLIEDVAKLIERHFDVDFKNSVNKLQSEDLQKFGYRSLHYVCTVPADFYEQHPLLPQGLKFEIQIRTILQHTWAEIEHDIGYKVSEELPGAFRRRFSQIASLLEIADREFAAIRTDLKTYERKVRTSDFRANETLPLDPLSLRSVLDTEDVRDLDREVALFLGQPVSEEPFFPDYILRALHLAGLKTVHAVLEAIRESRPLLSPFLSSYFKFSEKQWGLEKSSVSKVQRGYGLLFVAHLTVLEADGLRLNKINLLTKFYTALDYPEAPQTAAAVGHALVAEWEPSVTRG